jgi:peptidoglycan/LPS O-acetylase OafA/YrhL
VDLSSLNETHAAQRVPGIDMLRGLSILAVVVHHVNLRIRFDRSPLGMRFPTLAAALGWNGYYGVRIFFVISGFLIATWSLRRWRSLKNIERRQFYRMRFARIAPCLLGLLAILSVLHLAGDPHYTIDPRRSSLPRALLAALTFHVNWLEAKSWYLPASWDVLWSLSVEEVFYIFFPLICTWVRKKLFLIPALGAFVVLGPFARIVFTHNDIWADYGYLSCMDGIAMGCLAAMLSRRIRFGNQALRAMSLSGALLCIFITILRRAAAGVGLYKAGLDVTVLSVGTALLAISSLQRFEQNAVARSAWSWFFHPLSELLRGVGRSSYEIYLTHMFVIWPVVWAFYRSRSSLNTAPVWFLIAAVISGMLGFAVAKFYSEPLNRILRGPMRGVQS